MILTTVTPDEHEWLAGYPIDHEVSVWLTIDQWQQLCEYRGGV